MSLEPSRIRPNLDVQVDVAPQELRLDLPAAHSAARMARHLVRQFAKAGGLPESELDQLTLVADELLSNAVDHGGGGAALEERGVARGEFAPVEREHGDDADDAEVSAERYGAAEMSAERHGAAEMSAERHGAAAGARMQMLLVVSAHAWEVRVADQGGGDPDVVRELIAPSEGVPDLEDERGRGFFLMAQLVDSLEVQRSPDGLGLEMVARRRLSAAG